MEANELSDQLQKIDFHHPYTPYEVQEQFMKAAYDVLETGNGQIGILESPTGTVSVHDLDLAVSIPLMARARTLHHWEMSNGVGRENRSRSSVPLSPGSGTTSRLRT